MHRSTSAVPTKKNRKLSPPRRVIRNNFINNHLHAQTVNSSNGADDDTHSNNNKNSNISGINVNSNIISSSNSTVDTDLVFSRSFKYEYERLEKIGSGTYGDIWKVKRKTDHKIFVLKNVTLVNLTQQQVKLSMGEVEAMKKICHPNIIQFYESCMEGRSINIIMEHAPYGDLSRMIKQARIKRCYLNEKSLWEYLIQISEGLEYLHKEKILHRDIKAQNIFLDENLNIKIGDFGLVRMLGTHSVAAHSQVGTPLYFSPELCKEESYDEKSDVWSFGCLMYEMAALHPPFEAKNTPALINKIVSMKPKLLPDIFSNELKFVIQKMLEKNPIKRPSVAQILAYEPVQLRLPHSVFRREKENFRKQKKNFLQDLKIGQDAIKRIPKLERDIKVIKEDYERQISNLNLKMEKVKEEKVDLDNKLEEKEILVKKQHGKIQHIFKENRSLKERVKNLEENNRLRAANERKMKALYTDTKRKLEEEVRYYQRQRSRPPTPQRRHASSNSNSATSNNNSSSSSNSHGVNSTTTSVSTPGSVNRKQFLNRSMSGDDEGSPSQSPNPSPIPFSSKLYSPRSSRVNACTPPPSTYAHHQHQLQSNNGVNSSGGSNRSTNSNSSSRSGEHSPTWSTTSNISSTSKNVDRSRHNLNKVKTNQTDTAAIMYCNTSQSRQPICGGDLNLLKKKSKLKVAAQVTKKQVANYNNETNSSNVDCSGYINVDGKAPSRGIHIPNNIDDFIDNLNINNISIEMQRALEDEGDFEPNDLDDDAAAKLIRYNNVDMHTVRNEGDIGEMDNRKLQTGSSDNNSDCNTAHCVAEKDTPNTNIGLSLTTPTPLSPTSLMVSSPPGRNSNKSVVSSNTNNCINIEANDPKAKNSPPRLSRPKTTFIANSNDKAENDDGNTRNNHKIAKNHDLRKSLHINITRLQQLPKRFVERGLATPSPQIIAPPSISRLSIEEMEENSNENLEKKCDEEEYVEEEIIKSSIISNDFTRSMPRLRSSSSSSGMHSSSSASTVSNSISPALSSSSCNFVSRKTFYTRRSFNVDHLNDSPTMIRIGDSNTKDMITSPLQPKNFGNFSNHVEIGGDEKNLKSDVANVTCNFLLNQPRIIDPDEDEQFLGNGTTIQSSENSHPIVHQAATPSQPMMLSMAITNCNQSNKCAHSSMISSSVPKHSALSFKLKHFGLDYSSNAQDNETKELRFLGLYRWQRIRHRESSKPNKIKVRGVATGKVWRNGATFRLVKSTKHVFILYKSRNRKVVPRVKSFKVRCEKDGECDFKKVKYSSPVEISSKKTSLNESWFMLENKEIKFNTSDNSHQHRNKYISEIILEFDKAYVNLIESVVVLEFDANFKRLAIAATPAISASVKAHTVKTPVIDLHEEETIVQRAHSHRGKHLEQKYKKELPTKQSCVNNSEIAKLKARVQQLGYKSQQKNFVENC